MRTWRWISRRSWRRTSGGREHAEQRAGGEPEKDGSETSEAHIGLLVAEMLKCDSVTVVGGQGADERNHANWSGRLGRKRARRDPKEKGRLEAPPAECW